MRASTSGVTSDDERVEEAPVECEQPFLAHDLVHERQRPAPVRRHHLSAGLGGVEREAPHDPDHAAHLSGQEVVPPGVQVFAHLFQVKSTPSASQKNKSVLYCSTVT